MNVQNPITKVLKEFTNPDNTFNPQKFSSGNWSGIHNGVEFSLRKSFCCGSGYIEGRVEDTQVAIFYPHNQMIQVYLDNSPECSFNINPHSVREDKELPELDKLFNIK